MQESFFSALTEVARLISREHASRLGHDFSKLSKITLQLLEENSNLKGQIQVYKQLSNSLTSPVDTCNHKEHRVSYASKVKQGTATDNLNKNNFEQKSPSDQDTHPHGKIKMGLLIYPKGTVKHPSQHVSFLIKANLAPTELGIKDPELRQVRNGIVLSKSSEGLQRLS